jgi:tetratricopeptide (TPR) repeat protein
MIRILQASAVALGLVVIAAPATADVQWHVFDLRRQQCYNTGNQYTLEESIRGCSDIIRSRSITGAGRATAHKLRGDRYRQLGNYTAAIEDYNQVLRMSGHDVPAYYRRGEAYLAMYDYDNALADAQRVVSMVPDLPGGYRLRCEVLLETNESLESARRDCEEAVRINPTDALSLSTRGVLNLRVGANEQAWMDFDAALFQRGPHARSLYGRGLAATRLGRVNEGRADMNAAQLQDPEISTTYAGYGLTP